MHVDQQHTPKTRLTTPFGIPDSCINRPSIAAVADVSSLGFATHVLPTDYLRSHADEVAFLPAIQGAIFHVNR